MTPFPWRLLDGVSRSFGLSLRLLPGAVREPIALAYLLARRSDTEADGATCDAEKELLRRGGELEERLADSPEREAIARVLALIREGQHFDTRRFPSPEPLRAEELDRYTYLVAGSVGEFWTEVCARRLPGFSREPLARMLPRGRAFGQALQLVNILRDRHTDAAMGRYYLPPGSPAPALAKARELLAEARAYGAALRRGRLRAACQLPRLLAWETLKLVEAQPEAPRVKVSRGRVWWLLVRAWVV